MGWRCNQISGTSSSVLGDTGLIDFPAEDDKKEYHLKEELNLVRQQSIRRTENQPGRISKAEPVCRNKRLDEDVSLRFAIVILALHFLNQSRLSRHWWQEITFW